MPSEWITSSIADRRFRQRGPLRSDLYRPLDEPFRLALCEKRRAHDQAGANRGGEPDQRMEDEKRQKEDRNPGHVEEGGRPHAGKKGTDMLNVSDGLHHARAVPALQAQAGNGLIDRLLQAASNSAPIRASMSRACRIQVSLQQISREKDYG